MRGLVTGGAGYIESHVLVELCPVVDSVLPDNYSSSQAIYDGIRDIRHHDLNLCDKQAIDDLFASETFDTVPPLVGYKFSNDSIRQPIDYDNNLISSLNLISACLEHTVGAIVFSSPATEHGLPPVGRTRMAGFIRTRKHGPR